MTRSSRRTRDSRALNGRQGPASYGERKITGSHSGRCRQAETLTGKVAIVTGGSANLGKLFSQSLASDGANVLVHYRDPDRADEAQDVINDLKERGVEAIGYQADLTSNAEITRLVDAAVERFGHWDILVNTAGLIIRKPVAETTEEEFDQSFAINAKIPYVLMAGTTRDGRRRADRQHGHHPGRGHHGRRTPPVATARDPEHFTKAFAHEIGNRGVTVNCIAPGPQKTPFFYNAETKETVAWLSSMTISGDVGDPVDVVPVLRFLVAPDARWVTAQTIYVNGGMIAPVN